MLDTRDPSPPDRIERNSGDRHRKYPIRGRACGVWARRLGDLDHSIPNPSDSAPPTRGATAPGRR
jgi:hypothetical protein